MCDPEGCATILGVVGGGGTPPLVPPPPPLPNGVLSLSVACR